MLRWWTLGLASGIGFCAECIALFLWPIGAHAAPRIFFWPFFTAAVVAALCALSVLVLTARDMAGHPRGERIRAIRTFDVVCAVVVLGLTALQLRPFADFYLA